MCPRILIQSCNVTHNAPWRTLATLLSPMLTADYIARRIATAAEAAATVAGTALDIRRRMGKMSENSWVLNY